MPPKLLLPALLPLLWLVGCGGESDAPPAPPVPPEPPRLTYPASAAGDAVESRFGHTIADPYRWMEDLRSAATDNWVQAQNQFTAGYLEQRDHYPALVRRLQQLLAPPGLPASAAWRDGVTHRGDPIRIHGVSDTHGRFYFQRQIRNESQQDSVRPSPSDDGNISVDNIIYMSDGPAATGQARPLIDLNRWRVDPDDHIELKYHQVTPDGRFLVYQLQRNYSDLSEIHVIDLQRPGALPLAVIPHVSSVTFLLHDNALIYARPEATEDEHISPHIRQAIYHHPIGGQPRAWYTGDTYDVLAPAGIAGQWLYFQSSTDFQQAILRIDTLRPQAGAEVLIDRRDRGESFSLLDGDLDQPYPKLLVQTSQGAAMNRVVAIDMAQPSPDAWIEWLPRSAAGVTEYVAQVVACPGVMYAEHLDQGSSRLFRYPQPGGGTREEIALPGLGAVDALACLQEADGTESGRLQYHFSSLVLPPVTYEYDPATHSSTRTASRLYAGYDPEAYDMRRVTATSQDGTAVNAYIAHRKGLEPNGDAPTLLQAYGGFAVAMRPAFGALPIPLLESGGIFALAQVRGGGEAGTAWHQAGTVFDKTNTYDDVIAVASHLIEQGLTQPSRLGLYGRSNGGLTTAAVALRRPDLFSVVMPTVGVLDLLRYDRFTYGFGWAGDYGRPWVQAEFENLLRFSPLHRVQDQAYPPTYVFTGKSDGRVLPAHSYKFAATLQNSTGGTNPYLLYAFPKDGHPLTRFQPEFLSYLWTAFFHHTGARYTAP